MVSPAPAPTESSAITGLPEGRPCGSSGCTTRIFLPSSTGFFAVQTTLPMTLPRNIRKSLAGGSGEGFFVVEVDGVDDADDGGVHGAVFALNRHAGGAALDDEHGFAEAGVHRVDRHKIIAVVLAVRRDSLHHQQLLPFQARVLAGGDNGSDNASEKHQRDSNARCPASAPPVSSAN